MQQTSFLKRFGKITLKMALAYAAIIALVLALAIISIMVTFTFVVFNNYTESPALGQFLEGYLQPLSEFLWNLFMKLVPGI